MVQSRASKRENGRCDKDTENHARAFTPHEAAAEEEEEDAILFIIFEPLFDPVSNHRIAQHRAQR